MLMSPKPRSDAWHSPVWVRKRVLLAAMGDDEPRWVEQAIPDTRLVTQDFPGPSELPPAFHHGRWVVGEELDLLALVF